MTKQRLWTTGIITGLLYIAIDAAYGLGKIEGERTVKTSPSADADPSPAEDGGEEPETTPEPNGDGE